MRGWAALTLNRAEKREYCSKRRARGEGEKSAPYNDIEDGRIGHHAHFLAARATANLHSVLDIATAFWVWGLRERKRLSL